ncbi:MAG: hypothetical protein QM756_26620 [Polyangiaceae bacterium]
MAGRTRAGSITGLPKPPPDPDAERARLLARWLLEIATKLETPESQRAAAIDPERFDPVKQARAVATAERATVARMHEAWLALGADNQLQRDALRRELLLDACRAHGLSLRQMRGREGVVPNIDETLSQMAEQAFSALVPELASQVEKHASLVAALVKAHADNVGGRGKHAGSSVADTAEKLCKAMGFPAEYDSVKNTARRRRRQKKPPGQ